MLLNMTGSAAESHPLNEQDFSFLVALPRGPKRGLSRRVIRSSRSRSGVHGFLYVLVRASASEIGDQASEAGDQPEALQVEARRGLTVTPDWEDILHPGRGQDAADRRRGRDESHRSLSHFCSPTGNQERPQTRAIHERDAGQIEQQPRAISAHDVQQDLLKRLLVFEVEVTADLHEGAEIGPADAYG
jgi:hypothetical protein